VKFLIFDMDGVLVDTCQCHARAYRDLWERCGVAGPAYGHIAGRPTVEVVAETTRTLAPSAQVLAAWVAFKQQRARAYLRTGPVVYDDVQPSLAAIHRAGIGMGVATGASRETAELLLHRAGIAGFFRFVLTAEDVRHGKPDPEVYRRAAELSGVAAERAAVVEDSASGLEAAAAASTRVACVRTGLSISSPLFLGSFPGLVDLTRALGVELA
jgi:HAD superfamily hydrolase (TIGR01509 family)